MSTSTDADLQARDRSLPEGQSGPAAMIAARLMANEVRHYDWGSRTSLALLQGRVPGPQPEAELWMGAHPAAPSRLLHPDSHPEPLDAAILADPHAALGPGCRRRFGDRLPFLLKVLAVERALSIQVHPSPRAAAEVYAREVAAGLPEAARTYVDPFAKPEMLVAITPFEAMIGLRTGERAGRLLDLLAAPRLDGVRSAITPGSSAARTAAGLLPELALDARECAGTVRALALLAQWPAGERAAFVREVADHAARGLDRPAVAADHEAGPALRWVLRLAEQHPADPLVVAPLLLDLHELAAGQAVFVPDGVPHAYLRGVGVEIMASSDNVLRAGLTSKRIDLAELLRTVDPVAAPVIGVGAQLLGSGEQVWRPGVAEFQLSTVTLTGQPVRLAQLPGPQIVLCLSGQVQLHADGAVLPLRGGDSAFLPASCPPPQVTGTGQLYRAAVGAAG